MSGRVRPLFRRGLVVPGVMVATVVLVAGLGPFAAPHDPQQSMGAAFAPPGGEFLLGTDQLGRDVLSRVLSYGWPVLVVPLVSVVVAAGVGICGGLLLAARPGRGRQMVQVLDILLAVPPLLTLIVLGYVLPPGFVALLIIVTAINAPFTARFVRSLADGFFDAGFVEVSLVEGDSRVAIAFREVLPNLWVPLLGDLGNRFVAAMYVVVSAGFLGLAAIGGGADWASMITDSLGALALNPAAVIAPATGIGLLAVGVNLLADNWVTRR